MARPTSGPLRNRANGSSRATNQARAASGPETESLLSQNIERMIALWGPGLSRVAKASHWKSSDGDERCQTRSTVAAA
ncbi:hypothetical protein [Streptomyces sp. NBC_01497]|uniref:hypothetical protein n=1 Tax=Streptomyces sp. NBC_01497 TaxID=2903885 RepID=UPI002E333FFD|nr:hypothetical protein [Streptomyces sp. NBC_01497]